MAKFAGIAAEHLVSGTFSGGTTTPPETNSERVCSEHLSHVLHDRSTPPKMCIRCKNPAEKFIRVGDKRWHICNECLKHTGTEFWEYGALPRGPHSMPIVRDGKRLCRNCEGGLQPHHMAFCSVRCAYEHRNKVRMMEGCK